MKTTESREKILRDAIDIVCSDRNNQYGEPEDNFSVIAELWSAYLSARCLPPGEHVDLGAQEAADMLILFKVARSATAINPKRDTYVDIAGYAACAGSIACKDTAEITANRIHKSPVRTELLCATCRWGPGRGCTTPNCGKCEMLIPGTPRRCKCATIQPGNPCPYYERWNGGSGNDQ